MPPSEAATVSVLQATQALKANLNEINHLIETHHRQYDTGYAVADSADVEVNILAFPQHDANEADFKLQASLSDYLAGKSGAIDADIDSYFVKELIDEVEHTLQQANQNFHYA